MKDVFETGHGVLSSLGKALRSASEALAKALGFIRDWLSVPVNACIALLAGIFLASVLLWVVGYPYTQTVLYFPDGIDGRLRAELRPLPRQWGSEARAELVAREILLGPEDPRLSPDFPPGTSLRSLLLRGGTVYVDISTDAALAGRTAIERGTAGLERSLKAALPGLGPVVMTIGGFQPYLESLPAVPGKDEKKPKI